MAHCLPDLKKLVIACLIAIGLGGCNQRSSIPPEALAGTIDHSPQPFWESRLDPWTAAVPRSSALALLAVQLSSGGSEIRAYITRTRQGGAAYLGPLAYQFDGAPIQTLLFDIGGDRFIVGWVDRSIKGHPELVEMERTRLNRGDWYYESKTGVVRERAFLIPILADEAMYWSGIESIGVYTTEAMDEPTIAPTEWDGTLDPPINIEALLVFVNGPRSQR